MKRKKDKEVDLTRATVKAFQSANSIVVLEQKGWRQGFSPSWMGTSGGDPLPLPENGLGLLCKQQRPGKVAISKMIHFAATATNATAEGTASFQE